MLVTDDVPARLAELLACHGGMVAEMVGNGKLVLGTSLLPQKEKRHNIVHYLKRRLRKRSFINVSIFISRHSS
jgi:hypothetical protein